jgi:hypothetical protein
VGANGLGHSNFPAAAAGVNVSEQRARLSRNEVLVMACILAVMNESFRTVTSIVGIYCAGDYSERALRF